MPTDMPETLARYFAAQNEHDADGMVACFAADATVRDEGRTFVGRDAIRQWKLDTIAKYGVSAEPLNASRKSHGVAVIALVSGNFPGSPAKLTYEFALDAEGSIRGLEIG